MRGEDGRRYERVGEVMQALESGQIETWFQPVVDLETEMIAGAEALVRWRHPVRGVVSPDDFLPDIEAAGFMPLLTQRVLDSACESFATGLPEDYDWMVTVNLSKSELSSNVVEHVLGALDHWGLPARRLRLEIDERTVPAPPIVQILERLVDAGVPIIVDDFGTGWSSFGQLLRISPTSVKLDRQLVASVSASERDRGGRVPRQGFDFPSSRRHVEWSAARERDEAIDLISAFSTLATRLDMDVVAEGIETPMQRDLVRRLGCTLGQGHLFAPAMPFDTFMSWAAAYTGGLAGAPRAPGRQRVRSRPSDLASPAVDPPARTPDGLDSVPRAAARRRRPGRSCSCATSTSSEAASRPSSRPVGRAAAVGPAAVRLDPARDGQAPRLHGAALDRVGVPRRGGRGAVG